MNEAKARLEELVASGFKLFNEGKSREAMMVAETAVASNPSSTGALSLKGMCHEHLGEIAEALECYELVVKLNPDSALDRIKVNDLRNLLAARIQPAPATDRRPLIAAGIAAAVLVVTVGALIARGMNNRTQANNPGYLASNEPVKNEPTASAFTNPTTSPTDTTKTTDQGANPVNTAGQAPSNETMPRLRIPDGQTLPDANGRGGTDLTGPLNPFPNGGGPVVLPVGGGDKPPTTKPPQKDEDKNNGGVIDPPAPTTEPEKKDNPGLIEISVNKPVNGRANGNAVDNGSSANGAEATLRAAVNNFESKRYAEAAKGFERAIGNGQATGRNYQRLGDCYRYLGRNDDAVNAYSHAADIHKQNNNPVGEEVCRQQIKVLRGG